MSLICNLFRCHISDQSRLLFLLECRRQLAAPSWCLHDISLLENREIIERVFLESVEEDFVACRSTSILWWCLQAHLCDIVSSDLQARPCLQKMHLDKDILANENKIYSPDTCIYVPERINYLFIKVKNKNNLPTGVSLYGENGKYKSTYRKKILGIFDSVEEASRACKQAKEQYIKQVADEYKDKIPKKLYDAMYNWKER